MNSHVRVFQPLDLDLIFILWPIQLESEYFINYSLVTASSIFAGIEEPVRVFIIQVLKDMCSVVQCIGEGFCYSDVKSHVVCSAVQ